MFIDFSSMNEQALMTLLEENGLSKGQRKLVVKRLNENFGLLNAIVYIPTDLHPHYVKEITETGELGLNLLYGDKTSSQKNKRPFFWIDYHGNKRKSFHKSGSARIIVPLSGLDRVSGKRVFSPSDPTDYLDKNA